MNCYNSTRLLTRLKSLPVYLQRRYRYKQQWAMKQRKKKSACQIALDHFDLHYKPVFDAQWPSIRVALLSKHKHCALVNNFAHDRKQIGISLAELGAHDFIWTAREKFVSSQLEDADDSNTSSRATDGDAESADETQLDDNPVENTAVADGDNVTVNEISYESRTAADLALDYMPVKRIVSDKEQLKQEELLQTESSMPPFIQVKTVPTTLRSIPIHLTAYAYDLGDISSFPSPKKDGTNKLGYYPMDGSSMLPVIALDVEPGCSVLDLCAAPGGKSLAILQTLLPGQLTCVDESRSRLRRLQDILDSYMPKSYVDEGKVRLVRGNGATFVAEEEARGNSFDRVLVDVPCYTDRHVVTEPENNLFQTNRISERVDLTALQQELLYAGIRCCRPGGIIVYSTCTLSPIQNDGVVAATLEHVWHHTGIEIIIEDIRTSIDCFAPMFKFFDGCRYGNLVLPNLLSNFGPAYFCRLRRLS